MIDLDAVDLQGLGDLLDGQAYPGGHLDPATGEVWPAYDDYGTDDEDDDPDEKGWIVVEGEGSRGAYRDMELFAHHVTDARLRRRLEDALTGRGAFRRFRAVMDDQTEEVGRAWGRYRTLGQERRALRWLDVMELVDRRDVEVRDAATRTEMDAILDSLNVRPRPRVVDIGERLSSFADHWSPKVVALLNDYEVKLVKVRGEFVWHDHADTDELFLVVTGRLTIRLRDGDVVLGPGQLYVVPRGVEHCPVAEEEVSMLLLEPAGVVNTGAAGGRLTAARDTSLLEG
jgi:mannose-6-phosphate isomerase-like protein (cupin superfamily)